ncbi:uncharacterized protein LOC135594645 [Musa acuminata AAA Group]|uniref:uncharacterized protein LOC135594645 n=1 Tax=Musa acuminata AAA Group TaxID=214697 RepID=UPI0031DA26CF
MQSPRTVKDLQRLNGRLVALSRFLARSGDRCLPFFKAFKDPKNFQWTSECEEALKQMKQHLASLPRLAFVFPGEKLGLYLAASLHAISSVLVKESSGAQLPIFYVSHVLSGPEERYPPIEKLALALVLSARKLRPYFQAHSVEVITDQPLRQILTKYDVAARVDKDLERAPEAWTLHVDGSANSRGAGAGLVLLAPDGCSFERSLRFGFKATNNEAEYEALLAGLRLALEMQVAAIHVLTDSQLVAEQLSGGYEARDATMAKYLARVRDLAAKFPYFTLSNVPREVNGRADALAKLASRRTPKAWPEMEELPAPAIEVATTAPGGAPTTWVQELLRFKRDETLPLDEGAARRLRRTHAWDTEESGRLYKRSFTYPLLRCLEPDEARTVLAETHEGICGEHIGGRTLAHKILRQGYYWPTMCRDAKAYWGLDLLGPFPPASGQRKYIIVGVDYFTKWVEAEPLATTTEHQMEKFVWKNLVTRFGLPRAIVTDNGPQFAGTRFREFCAGHDIQLRFSSVAHPQTNGLAEVTNRSILDGLRRRVSAARSTWTDELPSVLWSLRTTPKTATGESPYSLTFGTEAVLPPEMTIATLRTRSYEQEASNQGLRASLDVLEERRVDAHLKALSHQRAVARDYNRKVRPRPVRLGDLVLRRAEVSDPTRTRGKLAPKWEGPFRVTGVVRPGTYRLTTMDGSSLPRTWNIQNLKKFFV